MSKFTIQKSWDLPTATSTQPNPDYQPVAMLNPNAPTLLPQASETSDDEGLSFTSPSQKYSSSAPHHSTPLSPILVTSSARSRKRALSKDEIYDNKAMELIEILTLNKQKEVDKTPFQNKVHHFCSILEDAMLKQTEAVFDAYMVDVLKYTQDYAPNFIEVVDSSDTSNENYRSSSIESTVSSSSSYNKNYNSTNWK